MNRRIIAGVICGVLVSFSTGMPSFAQTSTTAAIAGTVRDATGGVLPGVTVETTSPALIEKVRTVTTDDQGLYRIVELPPGSYTVTFTLTGFSTVRREGLQLSAGSTAPVNADMRVGGVEETVTVTGASPVVDVQNVRSQQVLSQDVLLDLPSGLKDIHQFASLTLGAASATGVNDVGGSRAESPGGITIHGSRSSDGGAYFDGAPTNVFFNNGGSSNRGYRFNQLAVQEVVMQTGAADAEEVTGGATINMVPKDGGNRISMSAVANYTGKSLSSGKVPDSLIARGSAPDQNTMKAVWDSGVSLGGPIRQDKLWYFAALRWWGTDAYFANTYYNKSTDWRFYEPDLSRTAVNHREIFDQSVRLTWQAAAKHKFTFMQGHQWHEGTAGGVASPEASLDITYAPIWVTQASWTYPMSDRLLFQVHASLMPQGIRMWNFEHPIPKAPSILELTGVGATPAGFRYNAAAANIYQYPPEPNSQNNHNERVTMSYITGAHAFKVGLQLFQGNFQARGDAPPEGPFYGTNLTFSRGRPLSITQYATLFSHFDKLRNLAVFAQDKWTFSRWTLNLGVRFDHYWAYAIPIDRPAGPFLPARAFPGLKDIPNLKDITPRLGIAYDVFGNGKTAVKVSFGRYLMGQGSLFTSLVNPANAVVQSATRTWNDVNGNYVADCVLANPLANGECGGLSNQAFGQPITNVEWDRSARVGWGKREYNYATAIELQQELMQGVGLTVAYHRTEWRNQYATVNAAVSASDFREYCITAPTDARLGRVSGKQICGLYDVNPSAFGRVFNLLMLAKDVPGAEGDPEEIFNGVDFTLTARLRNGGLVTGGVTVGRTAYDFCWVNNLPNVLPMQAPGGGLTPINSTMTLPRTPEYCHVTSDWWDGVGSQAKVQFVFPLPGQLSFAGTFKNLPGAGLPANYVVTNAAAARTLGRNLSGCPATGACNATRTAAILPHFAYEGNSTGWNFDDRLNELDLRVARTFRVGPWRIEPDLQLYNVFNARPAQTNVTTYGPSWQRPLVLLGGRTFKFGAQMNF